MRERFTGRIAGVGSASGVRVVVGRWDAGPWGPFADVMVEDAAGHRVLVAPDERTRGFVSATYSFDEVVIAPVAVTDTAAGWQVVSGPLALDLTLGGPTPVGRLLRLVPGRLATSPAWCTLVDPVARVPDARRPHPGDGGPGAPGVVRRHVGAGGDRPARHLAGSGPRRAGARRPAVPVRLLLHAATAVRHRRRDHHRADRRPGRRSPPRLVSERASVGARCVPQAAVPVARSGSPMRRSFCRASRSSWRTRSAEMPCLAPMSASLCWRPSVRP